MAKINKTLPKNELIDANEQLIASYRRTINYLSSQIKEFEEKIKSVELQNKNIEATIQNRK